MYRTRAYPIKALYFHTQRIDGSPFYYLRDISVPVWTDADTIDNIIDWSRSEDADNGVDVGLVTHVYTPARPDPMDIDFLPF